MAFEGDGTGSSRTTAVHDLVKRCRTEGSFSGDAKADPGEAAAPTAGAAGKSTVFAASPTTARQTKDQRELLDCPLCYEVMYPPIQQCQNGHSYCSSCEPKLGGRCPTCKAVLGGIRCLALEKLAGTFSWPCSYAAQGCSRVLTYESKRTHETQCRWRLFSCPYATGCAVTGDCKFLTDHLHQSHAAVVKGRKTTSVFTIKDDGGSFFFTAVMSCFGERFCLNAFARLFSEEVVVTLQFMGEELDAERYTYVLEVTGNDRKLTWEGVPRSLRMSPQEVFGISDCLAFRREHSLLRDGQGSFRLYVCVRQKTPLRR